MNILLSTCENIFFQLRNFRPRYLVYSVAWYTQRLSRKLITRSEISSFTSFSSIFDENFQKKIPRLGKISEPYRFFRGRNKMIRRTVEILQVLPFYYKSVWCWNDLGLAYLPSSLRCYASNAIFIYVFSLREKKFSSTNVWKGKDRSI